VHLLIFHHLMAAISMGGH